ncbi:cupin domain-containing protein [Kitasatospora sp. NPDC048540]|uniref:JmjC domain-containing protein n=1 Tax=Kitasatospora sp. NPDC048540 TaxID=3155634 RepID=UPI0033EC5581
MATGLARLVGTADRLESAWESRPFVAVALGSFSDVFDARTAERLIHTTGLPLPSVRLFRDGEELPAARVGRGRERTAGRREPLLDGRAVEREVAAGATLVLEELQTYCPQVAAFCRELTAETGFATYCAAFLTPAGARGVAPHYDTAGVLVRQVHGSKRWRVSAPTERWPVREWSPARPGPEPEPLLDVVLHAGECLYIPRGFVHVGDATEEASVHLSVALRPVTWGAVLRPLVERALAAEELRECLPYGFHRLDPGGFEELLAARAAALAGRLAAELAGADAKEVSARLRPERTESAPTGGGSLLRALTHSGPSRPAPHHRTPPHPARQHHVRSDPAPHRPRETR